MPEIIKDQPKLLTTCVRCGRTIRYTKDELREEFDGREHWTHLVCPACYKDNLNPHGKEESVGVPPEVMAAGERIARYRSGRTSKEVWGSRANLGFTDDLLLVAEHYLRSLGLEV